MTAGDWQRVRAAFEHAVELPATDRGAWLDRELGQDSAERAEVDRMLAAAAHTGAFLVPPAPPAAGMPQQLGPFRILRPIARGGMGAVYLAEQGHPARTVAVKVVDAAVAVPRARERFRAEVDALARLQHPGIAQVLEAGVEEDGTAWFAMELLDGALPITRFAGDRALPLPARLQLFLQVCAAIGHAHQRGVIHRDLKPGNILVLPDGTAKVIDFGIARVLDPERTAHTLAGELLGTLAYMSPEQVEGGDTDVRTDVHGLGVVLHELVTGRVPFEVADLSLQTACRRILEQDPPLASHQCTGVPPELDWILQRALRKAKDARYAGVAEFAADIARALRHEPVVAGPDSTVYRLRKFVRRHRVGVAAFAAVVGTTVAAFVMVATALVRTRDAEAAERAGRVVSEAAAARAAASLDFLLDMLTAPDPGIAGKDVRMVDVLHRGARDYAIRFADEPGVRAALGAAIGRTFDGLGQFVDAERSLQDAAAVEATLHGEPSRELARTLVALAKVQLHRSELDAAATTIARAGTNAAAGDEALQLVVATCAADVQRARGDRQGAVASLRTVVERLRVVRGDRDGDTLQALAVLATAMHEQGQVAAAIPFAEEVLAGLVATKGEDHPESLIALNNWIMLLYSSGRRTEMEAPLARLLAARRRVLGDDHPLTLGTINNLAALAYGRKDYAVAARWFEQALTALRAREGFSPKEETYLKVLSNLATAERELGHYTRAAELAQEAVDGKAATLGPNHDSTLQSLSMLADTLRQAGECDRAIAMFRECRERARACVPPQLANVYRCDFGEARSHLGRRDFAAAERLLLACRDGFAAAEAQAAVKGNLLRPDAELVALYEAWGRPEQAAAYRPDAPKADVPQKR